MARKKTPEDLVWDNIFSSIIFESEPPPKYIKTATIHTKTGKRIKLTGEEFTEVMEHERMMHPDHAIVESCKVTLDFDLLKHDVEKFAVHVLTKAGRQFKKSKRQQSLQTKLRKLQTKTQGGTQPSV
jgi:hypothetical protein